MKRDEATYKKSNSTHGIYTFTHLVIKFFGVKKVFPMGFSYRFVLLLFLPSPKIKPRKYRRAFAKWIPETKTTKKKKKLCEKLLLAEQNAEKKITI